MVLQGSQAQFHSAKQIANSWILHSAAAVACGSKIYIYIYVYVLDVQWKVQMHLDLWRCVACCRYSPEGDDDFEFEEANLETRLFVSHGYCYENIGTLWEHHGNIIQ